MGYNKARTADDQSDDLESFWMTTPAEQYRYGLLFSMLAGLAAVTFMFWRSRKTLPSMMTGSGKSESGQRRKARQSKQRTAKRARRTQSGNQKLAA